MNMDRNQAHEKARESARMRYMGESQRIELEDENQIYKMREQMAAHGMLMSSSTVVETAKIHVSRIEALTWARLDAILEGYELHRVEVDDQTAINICDAARSVHSATDSDAWSRDEVGFITSFVTIGIKIDMACLPELTESLYVRWFLALHSLSVGCKFTICIGTGRPEPRESVRRVVMNPALFGLTPWWRAKGSLQRNLIEIYSRI